VGETTWLGPACQNLFWPQARAPKFPGALSAKNLSQQIKSFAFRLATRFFSYTIFLFVF